MDEEQIIYYHSDGLDKHQINEEYTQLAQQLSPERSPTLSCGSTDQGTDVQNFLESTQRAEVQRQNHSHQSDLDSVGSRSSIHAHESDFDDAVDSIASSDRPILPLHPHESDSADADSIASSDRPILPVTVSIFINSNSNPSALPDLESEHIDSDGRSVTSFIKSDASHDLTPHLPLLDDAPFIDNNSITVATVPDDEYIVDIKDREIEMSDLDLEENAQCPDNPDIVMKDNEQSAHSINVSPSREPNMRGRRLFRSSNKSGAHGRRWWRSSNKSGARNTRGRGLFRSSNKAEILSGAIRRLFRSRYRGRVRNTNVLHESDDATPRRPHDKQESVTNNKQPSVPKPRIVSNPGLVSNLNSNDPYSHSFDWTAHWKDRELSDYMIHNPNCNKCKCWDCNKRRRQSSTGAAANIDIDNTEATASNKNNDANAEHKSCASGAESDHDNSYGKHRNPHPKTSNKKSLYIYAKRLKLIYAGLKKQLRRETRGRDNDPDPDLVLKANKFGPMLVKELSTGLEREIDWMFMKMEAHKHKRIVDIDRSPGSEDDIHWNAYVVCDKKLYRISSQQLVAEGFRGHVIFTKKDTGSKRMSHQSEFRKFMEYVFKYDDINFVYDESVCFLFGNILGSIKTPNELKTWYITNQKTSANTTKIISMIKSGLSNEDIMNNDEKFFFWHSRRINNFRAEFDRNKTLEHPCLTEVPPCADHHPSQSIFLRWFNCACVRAQHRKGGGWAHLWGKSNALKSWFISVTIMDCLPCVYLSFKQRNFTDGFRANTFFGLIIDGFSSETVANGFGPGLMEHGTIGSDSHWIFPKKHCAESPSTNGEFIVTIGNSPMEHCVTPEIWNDIVKNRLTQIEIDPKRFKPVALANEIRLSQLNLRLDAVTRPKLIIPERYYLSQHPSQASGGNGDAAVADNLDDVDEPMDGVYESMDDGE
eukprot:459674_1